MNKLNMHALYIIVILVYIGVILVFPLRTTVIIQQ